MDITRLFRGASTLLWKQKKGLGATKQPGYDHGLHILWFHFGVDEHPFATYFDVHQGYRVLTHSHI